MTTFRLYRNSEHSSLAHLTTINPKCVIYTKGVRTTTQKVIRPIPIRLFSPQMAHVRKTRMTRGIKCRVEWMDNELTFG